MSSSSCIAELKQASPAILPSLLLCDFANLAAEVERLEEAGVSALHLDVMDGVFVPNFTYGMTIVEAIRSATELPLDVHLMMVNPEKYLSKFKQAGADILTIHEEAVEDAPAVLQAIRELDCAAGIAINPDTPVANIESALPYADLVLIMSVHAGFGGQSFDPRALQKLQEVRELPGGDSVLLQIDGGINVSTIRDAVTAGAELLVAGSAIFKQEDYRVAVEGMMNQLDVVS